MRFFTTVLQFDSIGGAPSLHANATSYNKCWYFGGLKPPPSRATKTISEIHVDSFRRKK